MMGYTVLHHGIIESESLDGKDTKYGVDSSVYSIAIHKVVHGESKFTKPTLHGKMYIATVGQEAPTTHHIYNIRFW